MADIFLQINQVNLSLEAKQLGMFVPIIKFEFSRKKIELLKTYL